MRRTDRAGSFGRISGALAALAFVIGGAAAHSNVAAETVRIGVLKYGTVNWELDVIRHNGFDEAEGVTLEVTHFAGEAATAVALRAGDVDIVVTDWLETSRARSAGDDLTIAPYSTSVGAIMAPLGDLVGVQRQVAVLAYQMGDGLTNILVPTNAVLIGILTMAKIPYERWLQFIFPFMVKAWIFGSIALAVAVMIGWS